MKTLLPIALLAALTTFGQNPLCDGTRFLEDSFELDSTMNVVYGNSTSIGGINADLQMDIYEPAEDEAELRPLIILAHGGSFIAGSKEDMHSLCRTFARKGYVVATIDYRLFDGPFIPLPDSTILSEVVIKAVSDAKAAVRFFKEDADTDNAYRIDPNLVIVGGISAGAILMGHVAYLDPTDDVEPMILDHIESNGGWDGNSSDNTSYDTQVHGLLNYSGALRSSSYIQVGDAPLLSAHDDMDGVVPYGDGNATILTIPIIGLQGSSLMHEQAQALDIESNLITIENSTGHVSYFGNQEGSDLVLGQSFNFLHNIICGASLGLAAEVETVEINAFPNPASHLFSIEINSNFQSGSLRIFNMLGAKIYEENIRNSASILQIDCSDFATGVYTVQLISTNQDALGIAKMMIE